MPPKQKASFDKCIQERKLRRSLTKIFNEVSSHFTKTTLTDDEIALVKGSLDLLRTTFEEMRTLERELKAMALEEMKDEAEQNDFLDEGDAVILKSKGKLTKLELFISKREKPAFFITSFNARAPFYATYVFSVKTARTKPPHLRRQYYGVVWVLGTIPVASGGISRFA